MIVPDYASLCLRAEKRARKTDVFGVGWAGVRWAIHVLGPNNLQLS